MSDGAPVLPTLSTVPRIGFLGDTHGNFSYLVAVSKLLRTHDVDLLVVVGDFGFVWPGHWEADLNDIEAHLTANAQVLLFVDGNHDWHPKLAEWPVSEDGLRWLRPNIAHIPRGYRTRLASGATLAGLGGANSIDYTDRVEGADWWPAEAITEADLTALGRAHADLLIGHDAPLNVPALSLYLSRTKKYWTRDGLLYAARGRQMFDRGFRQVRPRLSIGGHYHLFVDEQVTFDQNAKPFDCRVVVLDQAARGDTVSQAILNVSSFDLEFLRLDGRPRRY